MIRVRVSGVSLNSRVKGFIVTLKGDAGGSLLPIHVGLYEGQAIAMQLRRIKPRRPLTHDLIKNVLEALGVSLTRIVVNDIRENIYFARIGLRSNNTQIDIDARPSDAIALALRMGAPIFVEEEVMAKAGIGEMPQEHEENKIIEELHNKLQQAVDREDFEEAAIIRDKIRELEEDKD